MNIESEETEDGIKCQFSYGEIETNTLGTHHLIIRGKSPDNLYHANFTADELEELQTAIRHYLEELEEVES